MVPVGLVALLTRTMEYASGTTADVGDEENGEGGNGG